MPERKAGTTSGNVGQPTVEELDRAAHQHQQLLDRQAQQPHLWRSDSTGLQELYFRCGSRWVKATGGVHGHTSAEFINRQCNQDLARADRRQRRADRAAAAEADERDRELVIHREYWRGYDTPEPKTPAEVPTPRTRPYTPETGLRSRSTTCVATTPPPVHHDPEDRPIYMSLPFYKTPQDEHDFDC